jgi:AcrR family transcriptional regulator
MGRPRRPLLSRDSIARTALDLLDREGQAGLTMRHLARELTVQAPSLYHHVTGQDEIIDLVHELVDSEIDTAVLTNQDWRYALQVFARSYRAAYLRHPHAVALVTRRLILTPSVLKFYDDLAAALFRTGLPPARVMSYVAMIDYIVLGSTVDDFTHGFADQPAAYAEPYPSLAAALDAADRDAINDDAFETCLRLVLAQLGAELSRCGHDGMAADDSREEPCVQAVPGPQGTT